MVFDSINRDFDNINRDGFSIDGRRQELVGGDAAGGGRTVGGGIESLEEKEKEAGMNDVSILFIKNG
ncbi:hypothetical protein L2E82_49438 [Cichorium intybus]|uniref:Uncharacterized protein n=1 Tax=Cichorium intybus TaxID=13427 RepID=A0ACB8Z1I8_CICIN|nr:hypothetical protein L2E82_49438 [Cichorium intybus]